MAVNHYFQSGIPTAVSSEQNLLEDIIIEGLKAFGHEVYYLPRAEVNRDMILTEDPLSQFKHAYMIEMFLEDTNGFSGENDIFTKFGVEFRDQATFVVAKRRWVKEVGRTPNAVLPTRPADGDLIYLPLTNSFFEIRKVEHDNPFYQLGKLYTFRLQCELFQFSHERINTDLSILDVPGQAESLSIQDYEFMLENGNKLLFENIAQSRLILQTFNIEKIDVISQNDTFDAYALDILDFSERNPFGEVVER